jgi:hypothetical protein
VPILTVTGLLSFDLRLCLHYTGPAYTDQSVKLAPFYDLISTVYYSELSDKMAMKIGGEYASHRVLARQFDKFAEEAGLGKAAVKRRIAEFAGSTEDAISRLHLGRPIEDSLSQIIKCRCRRASHIIAA